jgi:hypothetical protein
MSAVSSPGFSWRRVDGADHARRTRVPLAGGRYASDAIDQHAASWCGACYLVAAAQLVQDRAHIALGKRVYPRCPRAPRLSLQALLDHFEEWEAGPGWNACHGGFPLHVLECLEARTCPLALSAEERPGLSVGFPRLLGWCHAAPAARFEVAHARRVPLGRVRETLLHEGPVVLEINAGTLKSANARGVVTDLQPRETNHAVCVVGWEVRDGEECWVVRNSWGKDRVPADVPADADDCVGRGFNTCRVEWQPWRGDPRDPGFVLLPTRYAALSATAPSPWIAATVQVAGQ